MNDYDSLKNRRFLFQNISKAFPNNPWVIEATNKMKSYSEKEYLEIIKESYYFQNFFDEYVDKKILVPSKEAKHLFTLFIEHIEKFFQINENSYNELIELCRPNTNQFLLVNQDYSDLLLKILLEYKDNVIK